MTEPHNIPARFADHLRYCVVHLTGQPGAVETWVFTWPLGQSEKLFDQIFDFANLPSSGFTAEDARQVAIKAAALEPDGVFKDLVQYGPEAWKWDE